MFKFTALLIIGLCVVCSQCGSLNKRAVAEEDDFSDIEAVYYKMFDSTEDGAIVKRAVSCSERMKSRCARNNQKCNVWGGGFSCVW
ncbi:hypothetical protein ACHWQZ_G011095 [Mnemiopsis leidyi]